MRNTPKWLLIVVAGMAIAVAAAVYMSAPNPLHAQAPAGEETPAPEQSPGIDAATEVEIQRRFNDLRRELLDDRAASIRWWLSGIALLFTVLAIVIVAATYVGYRKILEIEEGARRNVDWARAHAEEARKYVDEIRDQKEQADERLRRMASGAESGLIRSTSLEDYSRDAGRAGASAIAEAYMLQEQGEFGEAIERWRHIATVAEGTNDDLAALAYRSIGDLSERRSRSNRT